MAATGDTTAPAPDRPMGPGLMAVLILMASLAPLSVDTYLPSLPGVARDLGSSAAAAQLSLTTFLVGLAIGQLVIGPVSDRLGRRRPLLVGSAVCVAASLVCALAPSVETLVAARFLQGASGAAGIVIARAVVADRTTGHGAARVFAVMGAVTGLAPVVAPLLGGLVAPLAGWRGVFVLLTVLTSVMAVGAAALVGESLPPERRTSGSGLARRLFGLAREPAFLAPALALACAFGTLFAYIAASPFLLQRTWGMSATGFSLVFAFNAVGLATSSAVSARLVTSLGPRRLLVAGLLLLLVCSGTLVLVAATTRADGPGRFAVLALLFGVSVSVGQVFGNATALALAAAPGRFGSGSALVGALQFAVGGLASPLAGLGGVRTALPMGLTMTGFAALALASYAVLSRSVRER